MVSQRSSGADEQYSRPHYRMTEETARVEDRLLESSAVETLILAFTSATGTSLDDILEPYVRRRCMS